MCRLVLYGFSAEKKKPDGDDGTVRLHYAMHGYLSLYVLQGLTGRSECIVSAATGIIRIGRWGKKESARSPHGIRLGEGRDAAGL